MKNKIMLRSAAIIATALFTGCGGGSSSSPDTTPATTLSGVVSDGPISNATVKLMEGQNVLQTVTTNEMGKFKFTQALEDDKSYNIESVGGFDTDTGEDFTSVVFKSPVAMFEDKMDTVVSPVTSLVAEQIADEVSLEDALKNVETKIGLTSDEIKQAPHKNTKVQKLAIKLSTIALSGQSFDDIEKNLDNDGLVNATDVNKIVEDADVKAEINGVLTSVDSASNMEEIQASYIKKRYEREISDNLEAAIKTNLSKDLSDTTISANIMALANSYYSQDATLKNADITASLLNFKVADLENDPFDATSYKVDKVKTVSNSGSLTNQFYKVKNPKTGNDQIVLYDSATDKQSVIKTNVILGGKVFVMSGSQENGKITYTKREYGVFLDPNSSSEIRIGNDGKGGKFQYTFYTDHSLKKFNASNTSEESLILSGATLNSSVKSQGLKVIDSVSSMYTNELDIDNSYVQVMAYDKLADSIKPETSESMLHAPVTVKLSDSTHVLGRPVSIIKKSDGMTDGVLLNYVAAHKKGNYPSDSTLRKRLQICEANLSNCTDIANADGNYFFLAENDTHVYMTKDKVQTIYAYDKGAKTIAEVSGVQFPANFDHHYHNIKLVSGAGHSGNYFNDFFTLLDLKDNLSEGNDAYVTINYDLDTSKKVGDGPFDKNNMFTYAFKNSMVLKLNGNTGVKVYDNGDGIDHMTKPVDNNVDFHLGLVAVKDGSLLVEAAKFNNNGVSCTRTSNCITYQQAWIDTKDQTTTKTAFDNVIVDAQHPYLNSIRVPPLALNDKVYIGNTTSIPNPNPGRFGTIKTYTFHEMALDDSSLKTDSEGVNTYIGRMYFERTSYARNGIYDGTLIIWKSKNGDIIDVTNDNKVIGNDDDILGKDAVPSSVRAKSSTNNIAGYGGLFGLTISQGHGSTPFLTSGKSGEEGSLKKVNHINGSWILD